MKIVRLSKNLILFSLIFTMFFGIIDSFVMPTYAYASEVEEVTEEDEEKEDNTVTIGVHRSTNLKTNQQIFSDTVLRIGKIFFGFVVFVVIILTGINAITNSYDGKTRAQIIEKFKHIIYGVLLFAVAATIVAVAVNFQETLIEDLYDVDFVDVEAPAVEDSTLETNWLANILEMGFKIIGRLLEYVIQFLFNVVSCNVGTTGSMTQYDLNSILFLSDFGDVIDFSATNKAGMTLTTAPFTVEQWDRYTKAYFFLSAVAMPIMLIAIIKAAYDMIINAGNFEKAMTVKKTVLRMVAGIIIVVTGPYLFRTVLTFFNMIVYLIPVEFSFDIIIEDIDDANGLIAVGTAFWWIWIKFKIMILFTVRNIMLTVMYIVTPVVIGFWTLSEKTKAFNKWIGETVTNAAMQFCYAMVFFIATIVLSGAQTNAFFTLLWLSMMMKLAEFFREMFQNLFDKWSGINELGEAEKMLGQASKFSSGAIVSGALLADPNMNLGFTRGVNNASQISNFLKTGKVPEFVTKNSQMKAKNKDDLQTNAENLSSYNALLQNAYAGYHAEYGKDFSTALSYMDITEGYSNYDEYLKTIPSYVPDRTVSERVDKGYRKAYYEQQVEDTLRNAGIKIDFNENHRDLEQLAQRASSMDIVDFIKNDNEGYYTIATKVRDLGYERVGFITDKNAIKAARDEDLVPSIQAVGKAVAKKNIAGITSEYLVDHPEETMYSPATRVLGENANLITLPSGPKTKSYVDVSDDYIKSLLEAKGVTNISNDQIVRERSEVEDRIASTLRQANTSIANQDRAKASVPDNVKQVLSSGVIQNATTALDKTIGLYKDGGLKADANMIKQLQSYSDALGYNGETALKDKYDKAIREISKNVR